MAYSISRLVREDNLEDKTHLYRASGSLDTRGVERVMANFTVRLTRAEQEQLEVVIESIIDRVKAAVAESSKPKR